MFNRSKYKCFKDLPLALSSFSSFNKKNFLFDSAEKQHWLIALQRLIVMDDKVFIDKLNNPIRFRIMNTLFIDINLKLRYASANSF